MRLPCGGGATSLAVCETRGGISSHWDCRWFGSQGGLAGWQTRGANLQHLGLPMVW